LCKEPFKERGVRVNKLSTNQFLISEPKQWLVHATREVLQYVLASFDFLWVFLTQNLPIFKKKSRFENSSSK